MNPGDYGAKSGHFGVKPGDLLAGKYRVERVLGVGGMGVVVSALHIQLGERVALKFLLPEALVNAEAVGRFIREARAAVQVKGEHVAQVSDVGQLDNGAPYIVMEFLDGMDLARCLRQWGPVPVDQAVEFILQACVAVADAHGLGIVHRDLKPANLFCTRRSDGQLVIKVLDFGISKLTEGAPASDPGGMAATRTSAVMGSPLYMSPEQMRSARNVDTRTDIWALGVILFELVSGTVPFQGETFGELAIKVATQEAASLRSIRPDVPRGLEGVIGNCLAKDRDRRYANVAELAVALLPFAPQARARALVERITGIVQAAGRLSMPPSSAPSSRPVPLPRPVAQASSMTPWSRPSERRAGKLMIGGAVSIVAVLAVVVGGVIGARPMRNVSADAGGAGLVPPPPPSQSGVKTADLVTLACAPGSTRCVRTTPQSCGAAGEWVSGAITADHCGAECTPGSSSSRCENATPEACGPTGAWQPGPPCGRSTVCKNGACVPSKPGPLPEGQGGGAEAATAATKDAGPSYDPVHPLIMRPL